MSDAIANPNDNLSGTNGSATVAFAGERYSKEERDIAFATAAMTAGLFNERQLQSAVANWTIHGDISLADHLQTLGLLNREAREQCEAAATAALAELNAAPGPEIPAGQTRLGSTFQRLDESGRISKLLGAGGAEIVGQSGLRSAVTRLTLVRRLGQGGLGTVWLARDENMQRYVALKEVTRAQDGSGAAITRFRREAEITGRLEHPGIVPVYECGEDQETERVFYTMRFLGKQTLHDSIQEYHERRAAGDQDPMLLRNLLTAFVSVCQAIGHAHSRKVIHRDLKPENVAIDSFGQVIVIDWGLAKVLDEINLPEHLAGIGSGQLGESQQTAAGQVFGTPLYMAPEQAAGRLEDVDERTDVYGLGTILFAILTGIAPHERSQLDAGKSGIRGLISAVASRPTPLAREANAAADPALEAICAKAMAKRRYARYQTATELAEEIQRWMAGEPVNAYREKRFQRLGRWVQHHRRTSQILATAFIIALVAGASMLTTSYQNHVAVRKSRFEEMKSDARELEVQLAADADHLAKNVRFMSNVPPIYGIIAARSGVVNATIESEESWRPRLELIYEGLLRANPEYLAISYLSLEKGAAQEIVRVERQTSDPSFIRRVPKGRLSQRQNDAVLDSVRTLSVGEVRLAIAEADTTGASQNGFRARMLGFIPVYDDAKGSLFGCVVIETDAAAQALRILEHHNGSQADIFVTDGHGQIWASSRPRRGIKAESVPASVTDVVPGTAGFFRKGNVETTLESPAGGIVANRIRLNLFDAGSNVAIVLHLTE
ncbi:MAG TPA: serine/threonine-protein kinase [Gemmataceae bacterium]|jgi:serine/threonine protein kinase|nr:serine/threonine-protein kinase [Gemmataceae bacterium]